MATVTGGAGNDTLNGTAASDTISGGSGDDWIVGSAGADSIDGGTGRDTVDYSTSTQAVEVDLLKGDGRGGLAEGDRYSGVDNVTGSSQGDKITGHNSASTLDGGAGDDTLHGGTGNNDLLLGGTGNDRLFGGDGSDNLQGGDGADSLDGGAGHDTLSGGAGSDTMQGGMGNDTFVLDGADSIAGGKGIDTLDASAQTAGQTYSLDSGGTVATPGTVSSAQFKEIQSFRLGSGSDSFDAAKANTSLTVEGGAGDDKITTGAASDTLSGDAGDDTISTGSGDDIVRVTQDAGSDVVTDFDMTMVGGQTTDQIDVSDLTDADGNPVTWRDVKVDDTNGDGSGDAILSFPGGEQITLRGVSPSQVTTWQQMSAVGIPCFSSETPILTPTGPRPVETLVRGDLVVTEQGLAPVIWTASRHCGPDDLARNAALMPVHFPIGAIGNDRPLRLSYQHAVRVIDARGRSALVRAGHLASIGFGGARMARGVRSVTWHHLLLPRHAIVFAAGAPCESFYPGPESLTMLDWPARLTLAATICASAGVPTTGPLCDLYGPRILPLLSRRALGGILATPPSAVPPL